MAITQGKSTRSPTGARNRANRGKRKSELGRDPAETKIDEKNLRKIRTRGGNENVHLYYSVHFLCGVCLNYCRVLCC